MLTVIIYFINGTTDVKDCWSIDEIVMDGVESIKIIRDERAA